MKFFNIFISFLFLLNSCSDSDNKAIKRGLIAEKAMVVSAHPIASSIGIQVLKDGGNAVDASVAVGFALAVCYPSAGNLGGGGFMVLRFRDGKTNSLDFREKAPENAHRDMYLDSLGEAISEKSIATRQAAGVPGSVAGLIVAHQKYGKLNLKRLIQPAIDLAQNGFQITENQANNYNRLREIFLKRNPTPPAFVKQNGEWKKDDTLKQQELAETLTLIRDYGAAGFYEGKTAKKIVAEMLRGNGIITLNDLKNYKAKWRKTVQASYKGHRIISMGTPSSGGIVLLQILKMIEAYPIEKWTSNKLKITHLITEAERRAFADRATHLGDADFYDVPQNGLLDSLYLANRMQNFEPTRASLSAEIAAGTPPLHESEQTTHYSIIDRWGNAAAVTTTINRSYGSRIVVAGAGFLLNNEMDDFSIKSGVPNSYGLVGGKANAIEANKRMLSSMTPTIVEKNGKLLMVIGTPGGSTIITSVLQGIVNVIDRGMGMQEAVTAGRFHHQWLPDLLYYEKGRFANDVLESLKSKGHQLKERQSIGRLDAILVLPSGELEAGADPRGDDNAIGF